MDVAEIQAELRAVRGTRPCKRLRKQGLVPAILYGHGGDNVALTLNRKEIEKHLADHNFILRVKWDGQSQHAQIKDIQHDHLGDHIIHVDLVRISLREIVNVSVPVETHGQPVGVGDGGVLELLMFEIEIECLPTAIPQSIRVEVAELGLHDSLTVGDIRFPDGVRPTAEPETPVVVVVAPTEEVEEEEAVAEPAAGPEVIGRVAEEEEEEEETGQ
jgi:large subunit ribosomal protein L25